MKVKITLLLLVLLVWGCKTMDTAPAKLETNTPEEIEAKKIVAKQKMEAGYLPGRIIYSDEKDDCQYTIQLKEDTRKFYYVDPFNLTKEFFTDGLTVWVKFERKDAPKRCGKAVPVTLIEIENRDE